MTRLALNPIFESYTAVGFFAVILLWLLFVRPRSSELSISRGRLLLGLRLSVIAVLILAMLRPSIVANSLRSQSAVFLLLYDQSRSMQQPAAAGKESRWERQQAVLQGLESELARFGDSFELRIYGYDRQLQETGLDAGRVDLPSIATGDQTDLAGCLSAAMQKELGRRVAGILLLGDGTQTAPNPRVDLQQTTHELARLNAPLYTVTFGPTGDAHQSRDISVENMPDKFTVFVKNEFVIEGGLRVRGYVNKEIPVEVQIENDEGSVEVLGPRQVTATRDNDLVSIAFPYIPQTAGDYRLTLRAGVQPGELLSQNNELTAFLTVLEGGLRVLYLYGELNGEQQLLRRSINAAPDIQLDDQYVSLLDRERWPIDLSTRLRENKYDAIFVESVDVSALSATDMNLVAEQVAAGTGFLMLGGYSSFGAGGYQESPWADLLPIEMGRFERQDLDPQIPISHDLHITGEVPLIVARPHPITWLAAASTNEAVWNSLPPLRGANILQAKPASQVLIQTTRDKPILVAGNYGRGRTLAFAGNSTSRWWRYGFAGEHRRLWRQIVLWLAHRDDASKEDVWVDLEERRFSTSQEIEFTAGASDAGGTPLRGVEMIAKLVDEQGNARPLSLVPVGDSFRGVIPKLNSAGAYRIELTANHDGAEAGTANTRFQVIDTDLELVNPIADHRLMARLANSTREAGGKPVAAEEAASILSSVRNAHQNSRLEVESKWELGDSNWSAWLVFLGLVGLITSEWLLRKRWGLV